MKKLLKFLICVVCVNLYFTDSEGFQIYNPFSSSRSHVTQAPRPSLTNLWPQQRQATNDNSAGLAHGNGNSANLAHGQGNSADLPHGNGNSANLAHGNGNSADLTNDNGNEAGPSPVTEGSIVQDVTPQDGVESTTPFQGRQLIRAPKKKCPPGQRLVGAQCRPMIR